MSIELTFVGGTGRRKQRINFNQGELGFELRLFNWHSGGNCLASAETVHECRRLCVIYCIVLYLIGKPRRNRHFEPHLYVSFSDSSLRGKVKQIDTRKKSESL